MESMGQEHRLHPLPKVVSQSRTAQTQHSPRVGGSVQLADQKRIPPIRRQTALLQPQRHTLDHDLRRGVRSTNQRE